MYNNGFDLENLIYSNNGAYFGGAVFISSNMAAAAVLSNLDFYSNSASLGKRLYDARQPFLSAPNSFTYSSAKWELLLHVGRVFQVEHLITSCRVGCFLLYRIEEALCTLQGHQYFGFDRGLLLLR